VQKVATFNDLEPNRYHRRYLRHFTQSVNVGVNYVEPTEAKSVVSAKEM